MIDVRFERTDRQDIDWTELDGLDDRMVSQRRAWLEFVAQTQRGEVVVARMIDDGETVGFLSGVLVRRLGLRIFGSPMDGWSTPFMGFNLKPGVARRDALHAAEAFAFEDLGCVHMELRDRNLTVEDGAAFGFKHRVRQSFESDLALDEKILFARLEAQCRKVRQAIRHGVTVEEAAPQGFAEEYYSQLLDVFAKHPFKPTVPLSRIRALIQHVHPTGDLLLLRAVGSCGKRIATCICPVMRNWGVLWGAASYRSEQHLRPNELLLWEAIRRCKSRGVTVFDCGEGGDYKKKYGVEEIRNLHFFESAHPMLQVTRTRAYALYRGVRNARSRLARRG